MILIFRVNYQSKKRDNPEIDDTSSSKIPCGTITIKFSSLSKHKCIEQASTAPLILWSMLVSSSPSLDELDSLLVLDAFLSTAIMKVSGALVLGALVFLTKSLSLARPGRTACFAFAKRRASFCSCDRCSAAIIASVKFFVCLDIDADGSG